MAWVVHNFHTVLPSIIVYKGTLMLQASCKAEPVTFLEWVRADKQQDTPCKKSVESAEQCRSSWGCTPNLLVNEWAWSRSRVCLLRLEVDLGSVLESELGQEWRYGASKACIG